MLRRLILSIMLALSVPALATPPVALPDAVDAQPGPADQPIVETGEAQPPILQPAPAVTGPSWTLVPGDPRGNGKTIYRVDPPGFDFSAGGITGHVPGGFQTDFVSAPWWGGWLLPRERMRRASTIHDWLLSDQRISKRDCDRAFRAALAQDKTGIMGFWAWLYVRYTGHRTQWQQPDLVAVWEGNNIIAWLDPARPAAE